MEGSRFAVVNRPPVRVQTRPVNNRKTRNHQKRIKKEAGTKQGQGTSGSLFQIPIGERGTITVLSKVLPSAIKTVLEKENKQLDQTTTLLQRATYLPKETQEYFTSRIRQAKSRLEVLFKKIASDSTPPEKLAEARREAEQIIGENRIVSSFLQTAEGLEKAGKGSGFTKSQRQTIKEDIKFAAESLHAALKNGYGKDAQVAQTLVAALCAYNIYSDKANKLPRLRRSKINSLKASAWGKYKQISQELRGPSPNFNKVDSINRQVLENLTQTELDSYEALNYGSAWKTLIGSVRQGLKSENPSVRQNAIKMLQRAKNYRNARVLSGQIKTRLKLGEKLPQNIQAKYRAALRELSLFSSNELAGKLDQAHAQRGTKNLQQASALDKKHYQTQLQKTASERADKIEKKEVQAELQRLGIKPNQWQNDLRTVQELIGINDLSAAQAQQLGKAEFALRKLVLLTSASGYLSQYKNAAFFNHLFNNGIKSEEGRSGVRHALAVLDQAVKNRAMNKAAVVQLLYLKNNLPQAIKKANLNAYLSNLKQVQNQLQSAVVVEGEAKIMEGRAFLQGAGVFGALNIHHARGGSNLSGIEGFKKIGAHQQVNRFLSLLARPKELARLQKTDRQNYLAQVRRLSYNAVNLKNCSSVGDLLTAIQVIQHLERLGYLPKALKTAEGKTAFLKSLTDNKAITNLNNAVLAAQIIQTTKTTLAAIGLTVASAGLAEVLTGATVATLGIEGMPVAEFLVSQIIFATTFTLAHKTMNYASGLEEHWFQSADEFIVEGTLTLGMFAAAKGIFGSFGKLAYNLSKGGKVPLTTLGKILVHGGTFASEVSFFTLWGLGRQTFEMKIRGKNTDSVWTAKNIAKAGFDSTVFIVGLRGANRLAKPILSSLQNSIARLKMQGLHKSIDAYEAKMAKFDAKLKELEGKNVGLDVKYGLLREIHSLAKERLSLAKRSIRLKLTDDLTLLTKAQDEVKHYGDLKKALGLREVRNWANTPTERLPIFGVNDGLVVLARVAGNLSVRVAKGLIRMLSLRSSKARINVSSENGSTIKIMGSKNELIAYKEGDKICLAKEVGKGEYEVLALKEGEKGIIEINGKKHVVTREGNNLHLDQSSEVVAAATTPKIPEPIEVRPAQPLSQLASSRETYKDNNNRELYKTAVEESGVKKGGTAVEVGACSNMKPAEGLVEAGLDRVIRVDKYIFAQSAGEVEMGRQALGRVTDKIENRVGDATNLPQRDGTARVVVFNQSLYFVGYHARKTALYDSTPTLKGKSDAEVSRAAQKKSLSEAHRILEDNGRVLIKTGNHRIEGRAEEASLLETLLGEVGFKNIEVVRSSDGTPVFIQARKSSAGVLRSWTNSKTKERGPGVGMMGAGQAGPALTAGIKLAKGGTKAVIEWLDRRAGRIQVGDKSYSVEPGETKKIKTDDGYIYVLSSKKEGEIAFTLKEKPYDEAAQLAALQKQLDAARVKPEPAPAPAPKPVQDFTADLATLQAGLKPISAQPKVVPKPVPQPAAPEAKPAPATRKPMSMLEGLAVLDAGLKAKRNAPKPEPAPKAEMTPQELGLKLSGARAETVKPAAKVNSVPDAIEHLHVVLFKGFRGNGRMISALMKIPEIETAAKVYNGQYGRTIGRGMKGEAGLLERARDRLIETISQHRNKLPHGGGFGHVREAIDGLIAAEAAATPGK